ncbi:retinitis pigmentosa 1-like 1 protein isoform X2 [Thrips palmi]|uniref:Retinitis pigmentosa 1-like 1 protein isoform X2 n=1 Tax=Thrips palmi TaxID=161013 RepID=A0A6P8ZUC1_THRPL|nr:retinitis pigmentosa 1-like 1 protein isoform X2 [Thrips palmi]
MPAAVPRPPPPRRVYSAASDSLPLNCFWETPPPAWRPDRRTNNRIYVNNEGSRRCWERLNKGPALLAHEPTTTAAMKEITRKLLKYLVWMKPSKEKDAARRGTVADLRNAKNGGKKRDDGVGVVLTPAVSADIAPADNTTADNAPANNATATKSPASNASIDIAPAANASANNPLANKTPAADAPVDIADNAADMSPAAIRLEGAAGSPPRQQRQPRQREVEVNDRHDNDLNNFSRSDVEDEAAILSRDFQKLNIGFPAARGAKPATPHTSPTSPIPPTPPTRVPGGDVASDPSGADGQDVTGHSKSTASVSVAGKDDDEQNDVDPEPEEVEEEEEEEVDDDDDEEEAREFKATMMRLSLTVSKTEVQDTFRERGPTRFPGFVARNHGPYDGFQSRGARLEEGDVLTEGHAVPQKFALLDPDYGELLIGMTMPMPNLTAEDVVRELGGTEVADQLLSEIVHNVHHTETADDFLPGFQLAPDGASDGLPSPHPFNSELDSSDSNGSDCVSTRLTEIGRIKHFKQRLPDSIVSQPSPDSMTSVSSPGSPWSTSTEGSSKSSTPPQMCRPDPPPQPPHYPLPEKTPPNFVDQVDRPYHKWMRSRFMGKAKLEGYGWDKANKSPELITLLRDAERTGRVDHQRIYECARGHIKYHIALLYEKDDNDKTALYYAARLHFDDRVAGFVAECLVEAQERCSKSNSGRRYRVDEELYDEDKDNIFHCLARWHRHGESYVAMAGTLLSIAPLVTLLDRPNKAGLLPVDLCRHSDLRAMLDPRNRPYMLGASLLPVMPAAQIFLPPCFSQR